MRECLHSRSEVGMGGRKRRGLGLRNDVVTTCKAVTLRGGQGIQYCAKEMHTKFAEISEITRISAIKLRTCSIAFFAYRFFSLVLNLQNESGSHCNCVNS